MTDPIAIGGAKVFDRPSLGFLSTGENASTPAKHYDPGVRLMDKAMH